MLWKLEFDEGYFRIYDSKKLIAGYFDPDYGNLPKDNAEETVSLMLKNHEKIPGGIIMVPLVKFGLFDTDLDTSLTNVEDQVNRVNEHLQKWKRFLSEHDYLRHSIRISHTDQDMLTITFPVRLSKPTPLEEASLLEELSGIMDTLQESALL